MGVLPSCVGLHVPGAPAVSPLGGGGSDPALPGKDTALLTCWDVSSSWSCSNSTFHCEEGGGGTHTGRHVRIQPSSGRPRPAPCGNWECAFFLRHAAALIFLSSLLLEEGHWDHTCIVKQPARLSGTVFHAGFQSMSSSAKYQKGIRQSVSMSRWCRSWVHFYHSRKKISTCYTWGILQHFMFSDGRFKYRGVTRQGALHC